MKNLITITLITLTVFTSCQKDYYLNDLNDAKQQTEFYKNQARLLWENITLLTNQISEDQITINGLNSDLNDALDTIVSLETENAIHAATIDSLSITITGHINTMAQLSEDLDFVNNALTDAQNQSDVQSSTINELTQEIASLEAEIAAYEPEIITVIEYVTRYQTIIQTQIEYVEVEVEVPAETEVEVEAPVVDELQIETPAEVEVEAPVVEEPVNQEPVTGTFDQAFVDSFGQSYAPAENWLIGQALGRQYVIDTVDGTEVVIVQGSDRWVAFYAHNLTYLTDASNRADLDRNIAVNN